MYSVSLKHKTFYPRYKTLCKIDQWCRENCKGWWGYDINKKTGATQIDIYKFRRKDDAFAFKMRWS